MLHDHKTGPPDEKLGDELFLLIERDQGRSFISDGIGILSRKEIFDLAMASIKYHAKCLVKLKRFMKKETRSL